jgi:hypothetical protein
MIIILIRIASDTCARLNSGGIEFSLGVWRRRLGGVRR